MMREHAEWLHQEIEGLDARRAALDAELATLVGMRP